MVSRSFAKIFLSMTEVKPASLAETPGFATTDVAVNRPIAQPTLDSEQKSNTFGYIKP